MLQMHTITHTTTFESKTYYNPLARRWCVYKLGIRSGSCMRKQRVRREFLCSRSADCNRTKPTKSSWM